MADAGAGQVELTAQVVVFVAARADDALQPGDVAAVAAARGGVDPEDFQPPVPTPPVVPFRQAVGCPSRRAGCRRSGCSPQNLRLAAAKVSVPHGPIGKGNTP